jgi:hypothetical protein
VHAEAEEVDGRVEEVVVRRVVDVGAALPGWHWE